jgi:hypothetical protein
MSFKTVLLEMNAIAVDRIVAQYAIGGPSARHTFYLEPVATVDVDILSHSRHSRGVY